MRRLHVEFVFVALRAPGAEWYLLQHNMAESDGKPASSPLSTEEADRLSEKFKPSWEAEPEPPTVPKVEPPVRIEPTISVEPAVKIEPTVNVGSGMVVPSSASTPTG